jgi:hypothetical protein
VKGFELAPNARTLPDGDLVVVCGPLSAPVAKKLIADDPTVRFAKAKDGRWYIRPVRDKERMFSPSDEPEAPPADLAYVARRVDEGRVIVHIAGIHASDPLPRGEPSGAVRATRRHFVDARRARRLRRPGGHGLRARRGAVCVVKFRIASAMLPDREHSQDRIFTTDNAVIVLDGASAFEPGGASAADYVDHLGEHLAAALRSDPAADLRIALESAIAAIARRLELEPDRSPASTVSIARTVDDELELLVLGDTPTFLR